MQVYSHIAESSQNNCRKP